jgi:hypothetical protein
MTLTFVSCHSRVLFAFTLFNFFLIFLKMIPDFVNFYTLWTYVYLIQGKADELNLDISLYAIDRKDEFKVKVGFDL